ncbi:MAG TPA: YhdP family protein [Ramlibacter sp.]|nr:YhdP family protein [Ramlibacter sp.]
MNDSPPTPSRPLKAYAAVAKWSMGLLLTAWLVLVLAWGALHAWIVPRIGELRPDLEIEAGRVLGVPVRIGSVTARSEGLIPSFELIDVVLLDPRGRPALRLPRVVGALSPRSLWNLGFAQLYIERPELDIRRAADGRIFVAGLDFSRTSDNDGRAAEWFFRQTEFVVHGGTLRWTDEMRAAPPLTLDNVDFVMRNSARRHAMRLDATPPVAWGDRFSVRGVFRQPLLSTHHGRWQEWDGQVHGDFSRVDVSRLREHASVGIEVSAGYGAVRAWVDVAKGQFAGGAADIALSDVNTRLGPQLTPLALNAVSGRLGGKRLAGGFEFQTQALQFETREGLRWPGGNLFVQWTDAEGSRPAQGLLRGDQLDLLAISQVAARLPLGPAAHAALAAYAPKGLVERVEARWQGPLEAPQKYEARGRAVRLEVAARPAVAASGVAPPRGGTPGLRGANVDFDFTQGGGKGRLQLANGAVEVPGVFEDPVVPFDQLMADVQWQVNGQAISASVANLKFSNADAQGEGRVAWRTGDTARNRFPGVLDLQAGISRADGARVWRYLPLGVNKNARDYVRDSVIEGAASGAKFRVRGDLRDFPFKDGRLGEFRITTDVRNVTYAYVPRSLTQGTGTWPALTQLGGELVFEGNGMRVRNAAGRFAGASGLQARVEAQIPDFGSTTVGVTGEVKGPLGQAIGIVNTSPLNAMVEGALARATGSGNAEVRLKLELPISDIERSRVQGSVTFANNDIQVTPDTPLLARSRGTVSFSERGFSLAGVQARALGGDVRLEGGSRGMAGVPLPAGSEATVQLRAQGTATAEGLRQAKELGFVSRLAQQASGASPYAVTLTVRRNVPEIAITSSLQGLALALPPPLAKSAEAALPLRYESALVAEPLSALPGSRAHDQLTVELGRLVSVNYVRDVSGAQPQVVRGAIGVGLAPGEAAPLPQEGVIANVNLAAVNLDAWEQVLGQATGGAAPAASTPAPGNTSQAYLPTVMAVRARELTLEGRTLHNVVVGGSRDGQLWRANVDADELNGYLEYRQSSSGAGGGRLHARLARLAIGAATAKEVEALLDQQPDVLPGLDVVVEDFDLRGKKLGRLEIEAVNRGAGTVAREGGVREWRLNKLNVANAEAAFSATGNWVAVNAQAVPPGGPRPGPRAPGEPRRTAMKFRLDIADAGLLLARFGMKDVVRRGRGRMEGQVAWLGSPLSLHYPSMDGAFHVNVEGGQFLKADPGLAKLLGVLSLQSLPRRLALDFRDVFSEGFAFDFVRGDVTIEDGIAATNNLQMKGVNAAVLMEGRADIARETQDIKVVVVPDINAGTASLVASVINPAIGLGTFLAQMFLREPLMRAATQEFHIDGTWADPRIARVPRRPVEGATDAAQAPRKEGTN